MAAALDMSDEVLDVFSRSKRTEMTLVELHNYLATRINRISMDEALRLVRSPNLVNLFNLQSISHDLCLVQFTPKMTLCEGFLQKGCKNKANCNKLHVCRYSSHFPNRQLDRPCHFPHKFSDYPNNVVLLRRFNLDTLNEDLLLDLLRLHYAQSQSEYQTLRPNSTTTPINRSTPPHQLKKSPIPLDNPVDRQVDISIPSEREAADVDVDLEIVQLLLATKDIIIERIVEKQISNEFYRRFTLQLPSKQILDRILADEPIILYKDIPIKLKRTQRRRDAKSIALKFSTDQKIDALRLNLYIKTLVREAITEIFRMTPEGSDEQIFFIRSDEPLDFDHLYKMHSAKNTLQEHRVVIAEVYEAETLAVSFTHRQMTVARLRKLFGERRWQQEVFACLSFHDQQSAEIELMNAEITTKWLSEAAKFERELSVTIRPVIDLIQSPDKPQEEDEDDEEIRQLLSASKLSHADPPKEDEQTFNFIIKPDWRIVLTHPVFGDEYRRYIREHLNISIQIIGSTIQVPNEYIRKELARYTNMFVQMFVFQEISSPDKAQVKLFKDNYSRMAHKWRKDTNTTLLVARRDTMNELFPRPISTKPLMTPTFRPKQSPIPRTPSAPISPEPTPVKTLEENLQVLPYSIENSTHIPFFNPSNSFRARLSNYLSLTFHIKLEIEIITSSKIILKLEGRPKDVSDARSALNSLFHSLKTKTYPNAAEYCQFSMPDFEHVAQWNLDQDSIVSSCSFSKKNGGILTVRYFSGNPQFGTDENKLDEILLHRLCGISYQILINTAELDKKLQKLEKRIQQRSDYKQNICCLYDQREELFWMHLGGTKSIVQQISQDIQKIIDQYAPVPFRVQLQPNEVEYLLKICSDDLIKFEKEHDSVGVDLRARLKAESSEFLAPKYLHEEIQQLLSKLTRIHVVSKDFQCSSQLINKKKQELNNLAVKYRCLMAITLSSPPLTSRAAIPALSKISSGGIQISSGDLAAEPADVLVVCSSSLLLRTTIIKQAGLQVEQELAGQDFTKNIIHTSTGQLKQAKHLLFIHWTPPTTYLTNQDIRALDQSIATFVQCAIEYAVLQKSKSIAFPAIGCGGFGISPDVIATIMINAVRQQLADNQAAQLTATFVVQQPHVFETFKAKLKPSSTASRGRSPSPPRASMLESLSFSITLTTANDNIDTAKKLLKEYEQMLNS